MKLFSAAFLHETNRFSPIPTSYESCIEDVFYLPEQDPEGDKVADIEFYGEFVRLISSQVDELIIGPAFGAQPSGFMQKADYEKLRDLILTALKDAGKIDAVILFLHGAQMAVGYDDCEGDLLHRIREIVGPDTPIAAILDLHGNLSTRMLQSANLLVACKEYPHTDYPERILELLTILEKTVKGEIKPVMTKVFIPVLGSFHTTKPLLHRFVEKVKSLEKDDVLSISMMHGFPWADTRDTGANILVVSDEYQDKDALRAKQLAKSLAMEFEQIGKSVGRDFSVTVDQALAQTEAVDDGLVVIADIADNAGGGSPSDSTFILKAMLEKQIRNAAIAMIWDPVAVQFAIKAGIGAKIELRIGGKVAKCSGDPVDTDARVTAIDLDESSNPFIVPDPKVAIRVAGIDIVLNSIREQVYSPDVFTDLGIDIKTKKLLVVKSSQHFYAAFAPIAKKVIYCNTDGCLNADLTQYNFQNIQRPMWPLDE